MARRTLKNLIDGEWVDGEGTLTVTDPYNDRELGRLTLATKAQVSASSQSA